MMDETTACRRVHIQASWLVARPHAPHSGKPRPINVTPKMGDPFVRPGIPYPPHIEALVLRVPGTGDADTTAHEWIESQHRDTLALMVDRVDHLAYAAVAENVCLGRMRHMLLSNMAGQPCGAPPERLIDTSLHLGAKRDREEGGAPLGSAAPPPPVLANAPPVFSDGTKRPYA